MPFADGSNICDAILPRILARRSAKMTVFATILLVSAVVVIAYLVMIYNNLI